MSTVITLAFERWNADQILKGLPARPDTIIFANVPGQDPNAEIDRGEGVPSAEFIVHQDDVTQYGLVNENAVAYSIVLDTRIGDFDFNWLGLLDSESGTLCMIVHTLPQQKIATGNGQQGNNITRTFLMEFDGAADASQITVTAETWQIDYSARLSGIDESVRLTNLDHYGRAAFFDNGFNVTREVNQFRIAAGVGYVGGLRVILDEDRLIDGPENVAVWVDASLQGTVTGKWTTFIKFVAATECADYVDSFGFNHYVTKLAVEENAIIEDVRPATPLEDMLDALDDHAKSRNHPDATLTDKGFTSLSSSVTSTSETEAATPNAVKITYDLAKSAVKTVNGHSGEVITLSAADVDSVSASMGGIFQNPITSNYTGGYSYAEQYVSTAPYYNEYITNGVSEYHPAIKQRATIDGISSYAFSQGTIVSGGNIAWNLHMKGSGPQSVIFTWNTDGDFVAPRNLACGGSVWAGNSQFSQNGDINGSVWGGLLSGWVNNNFSRKNTGGAWSNWYGYHRCGETGIFEVWGRGDFAAAGTYWIAFPTPFPGTCCAVSISINAASTWPDHYVVYVTGFNKDGFNLYVNGIGTGSVSYIAKGA